MVPSECILKNIVKRVLPTAVLLASGSALATDLRTGKAGQKSAAATLTINVVVMPVVQTANNATVRPASNQTVSYNFPAKQYEKRYELRKVASDKAPGSTRVLQTLTIIPE